MSAGGLTRREVLLPSELLPDHLNISVGIHHSVITKIEVRNATQIAHLTLTDFKKLKIELQLDQIRPHIQPKPEKEKKPREWSFPTKRPLLTTSATTPSSAPKKKRPVKIPEGIPVHGPALQTYLQTLKEASVSSKFLPGTQVWAKTSGNTKWPGVAWSISLCRQRDIGDLVLSYKPGTRLVRFYGQHSTQFLPEEKLQYRHIQNSTTTENNTSAGAGPSSSLHGNANNNDEDFLFKQLRAWGRQHNNVNLVKVALAEMAAAHETPEAEVSRMNALYETHLQQRWMLEIDTNCYLCRDGGSTLHCGVCDRKFHSLCLRYPAVSEEFLPEKKWECPVCFEVQAVEEPQTRNLVNPTAGTPGGGDDGEVVLEEEVERMGLTPDWLIAAAAFQVFKLERPHAQRPYIKNLLDPCTNSKLAPNIPAEVLYDKKDDGLKLCNSWAGYHILLNPDYRAQIQWRFVNRAIDEVENGSVPAVILVVRNSTDTAYFQRLRPYPRVMLRRTTAQFKDYNKSPPGFGIAVFCVAQHHKRSLFADFVAAFEPFGEPTIPFDIELLKCDSFYQQLERSKAFALKHYRDHWVQCNRCNKWRIIDFGAAAALQENDEWSCSMLRPPETSCETPLTRFELAGGHYVARNGEFGLEKESEDFRGQALWQKNEDNLNNNGGGSGSGDRSATAAQPKSPAARDHNTSQTLPNSTIPTTKVIQVPEAAVMEAISVLPLHPLQAAIKSQSVVDSEVVTALELARLARIAANRAYLQHIASNPSDTAATTTGAAVPEALPGNHAAVLLAAREVSRIAALQTCASQKESAWQLYEQARRKRQEEEAPLLAALEKIRHVENEARQRWEGAQRAADEIMNELDTTVAID